MCDYSNSRNHHSSGNRTRSRRLSMNDFIQEYSAVRKIKSGYLNLTLTEDVGTANTYIGEIQLIDDIDSQSISSNISEQNNLNKIVL